MALSGFTGFVIKSGTYQGALLPVAGILILAMGSAVLNHISEYTYDAKMKRTAERPLPSGRVKIREATTICALLIITGAYILFFHAGLIPGIIGMLTIFWYNGVYTYMKRISSWAVIPGSLVGALPPAIGYTAAGGSLTEVPLVLLAALFFTGQIPHFWLLMPEYGKDYTKAGFKSLSNILNTKQIKLITFSWILSTALIAMLLPTFRIVSFLPAVYGIILLSVIVTIYAFYRLIISAYEGTGKFFVLFNMYFLAIMIFIWIDAL